MVKERLFGEDSPFNAWLREQGRNGNLPSSGNEVGITVTDVDVLVKCWKNAASGKRVRCLFWIEYKTRGGSVDFAQADTFRCMTAFAKEKKFPDFNIRFYGVFRLIMSGTRPDDSQWMRWDRWNSEMANGREWRKLPEERCLKKDLVSAEDLLDILACRKHPCSLRPWKTSVSHHGETVLLEEKITELGFSISVPIRKAY